ncbi:IclR family transcriptional regulator [Microbacterium insulae]|uniref:IclR family transcriptional regulator n=1 Tax=Microbacterium insulae TaxID=483014 RepID=A0ABW3AJ25_9MICO
MISSVDHALRLVQMLRDSGSVSLTRAAAEIGVSPSTVHRMMGMLVYRGFAQRDADRRYVPGPAMSVGPVSISWAQEVKDLLRPHVELLANRLDETANLMIRIGSNVRFLHSVEVANVLRIGDRTGSVLPAHRSSGGKALLAESDEATLERLYRSKSAELAGEYMDDARWERFLRELALVRSRGYARNDEETELGICALGFAIHDPLGRAILACSVAAPAFRAQRLFEDQVLALIDETRREMERDLAASDVLNRADL